MDYFWANHSPINIVLPFEKGIRLTLTNGFMHCGQHVVLTLVFPKQIYQGIPMICHSDVSWQFVLESEHGDVIQWLELPKFLTQCSRCTPSNFAWVETGQNQSSGSSGTPGKGSVISLVSSTLDKVHNIVWPSFSLGGIVCHCKVWKCLNLTPWHGERHVIWKLAVCDNAGPYQGYNILR